MPPAPRMDRRRLLGLMGAAALGAAPAARAAAAAASAADPVAGLPAHGRLSRRSAAESLNPGWRPGMPAVEVVHGSRSGDGVALTVHGVGDPALAAAALAAAEHAGARLTVFAVGTWLSASPSLAERILAGGHELANHSLTGRPMTGMSAGDALREVAGGADVLHRQTGTPGLWFRPAGTSRSTPTVLRAAGRVGYPVSVGYDVDATDHAHRGAHVLTTRVLAEVQRGSIVALGLGQRDTVEALPRIVRWLGVRGLRPLTVRELLRPAG